jgi:hypothetical protein
MRNFTLKEGVREHVAEQEAEENYAATSFTVSSLGIVRIIKSRKMR